jgi:hypothetical protein
LLFLPVKDETRLSRHSISYTALIYLASHRLNPPHSLSQAAGPNECIDGILAGQYLNTDAVRAAIHVIGRDRLPQARYVVSDARAFDVFIPENSGLFFTSTCVFFRTHHTFSGRVSAMYFHYVSRFQKNIKIIGLSTYSLASFLLN